ncbi:MAG: serine/threonine protein kinase [Candidatus Abyssobacteria bacterium SURF_17]|uniref:non-specific serine/threonine protein kinase n=1 Tax=Candidatus Abyssobacteria bacterium SURF_17 TaxID=2093361 RepID=A0A419EQC9_9BACT|nr:MAG: serine/threonine protein kinase [Candidatus Abyssubacteria bacterium SURF_17]
MADVYLAEDTRDGRWVALKTLPRAYRGSRRLIARFEREISSLRRLDHPNIIKILDEGLSDGLPYYVMEYIAGPTLKDVLRESGPFSAERVVEIASAICSALAYAHGLGIVHRDIKPANIIVGSDGEIKVADFGIAQAIDRTRLTDTGAKGVGTPQYMSPEQIRGERVDGRSDLYSLGILLFELLTGRIPFSGKTPIEIAVKQIEETPPEPRSLVRGLPEWLNSVILQLMEKAPEKRLSSAHRLDETLRSKGATIPRTRELPTQPIRIHPDLWFVVPWAGVMILVAAIILAQMFGWPRRPSTSTDTDGGTPPREQPKNLSSISGPYPDWRQDPQNEIRVTQITKVDSGQQPVTVCSWSPNGNKIALAMANSDEVKDFNIYILDTENNQPPRRISADNDRVIAFPRLHWLPDGGSLIYEGLKTEKPEFVALPCRIQVAEPHSVTTLTGERWTSYIPTRRADNNYYAVSNEAGIRVVPIDSAGIILGNPTTISSLPLYGSSISTGLDKMTAIKVNAPEDHDLYILNDVDLILSGERPPITNFEDARLVCIDGSRNYLENAMFSVDGEYIFYTRDVTGRFTSEMGQTGQQAREGATNADFEIMYARADDKSGPRRLFLAPHNQFSPSISPDGTRLAFINYYPKDENDERWELLIADMEFKEPTEPASANEPANSFETGFDSDDLSDWADIVGNWAVTDGVLSSTVEGDDMILFDGFVSRDCKISFRMRVVSGEEDFWVSFRNNYGEEPRGYSYYQLDGGSVKIRHNDLQGWKDISEIVSVPRSDGRWHTIECEVRESEVRCLQDGKLMVSSERCPINTGTVGFRTHRTKVEIDDLRIENLGAAPQNIAGSEAASETTSALDNAAEDEWPPIRIKSVFDPNGSGSYIAIMELNKRSRFVREGDRIDAYEVVRMDGEKQCLILRESSSEREREFCVQ